jgi:hypothetical protein
MTMPVWAIFAQVTKLQVVRSSGRSNRNGTCAVYNDKKKIGSLLLKQCGSISKQVAREVNISTCVICDNWYKTRSEFT